MIKDIETIIKAKRIINADGELLASLREWHDNKGTIPLVTRDYSWDDWLLWKLADMSEKTGKEYPEFPTAEQLVLALRVNALGDFVAVAAEQAAKVNGWESDIDCYVEDGIVYSSIWLKSGDAVKTRQYADRLAMQLNRLGYSAEVWVDEEDDREATVNAQLDFPLYFEMAKKGISPECLLCNRNAMEADSRKEEKECVEQIVRRIIHEHLGTREDLLSQDVMFDIDLGADTLDMVYLIMAVEEEFNIVIYDEEAFGLTTVGKLVDCVKSKI